MLDKVVLFFGKDGTKVLSIRDKPGNSDNPNVILLHCLNAAHSLYTYDQPSSRLAKSTRNDQTWPYQPTGD